MTDREQAREQSEFEAFCNRDCSPGAHTSEWYRRIWHESWQAATAAAVPPGHVVVPELVRDFVQEFADEPCAYKDSCPSTARHYRCVHCRARDALATAEGK